jgi:hypothetical protein
MEAVFGSVAEGIRKVASIANGWLAGPERIALSEKECDRLVGSYRAKDGRNFEVIRTEAGFRIEGLTRWELSPIDRATLFTGSDPELIVRFKYLQNGRYNCLVATHPLRLTTIALRG